MSDFESPRGETTSFDDDDPTGSNLVARVVERAIDRPVHRSFGMRIVEDLVESALFTRLEHDLPSQALREMFVRSMIDGLCDVAVKRVETKARTTDRKNQKTEKELQKLRDILSKNVAVELVENAVLESASEAEREDLSRFVAHDSVENGILESGSEAEIELLRHELSRQLAELALESAVTDSEIEDARRRLSQDVAECTIDVIVMDRSSRVISKSLRNASSRKQRNRSVAAIRAQREAAARNSELTYAARVLQRWIRDRNALHDRRKRKREGQETETSYAVHLVSQWTAERAARKEQHEDAEADEAARVLDGSDAEVADDERDVGVEEDYCAVETHIDAESSVPSRRLQNERQHALISKWMPVRHPPRFKSDGAAQAFMGRVLALSREERISRADFQVIHAVVMNAIQEMWYALQSRANIEADERAQLLRIEYHSREDLLAEYNFFKEAAYFTAWSIRYGEPSAEGYETICKAVSEAEFADRQVLIGQERESYNLLWRNRPTRSIRLSRRIGAAVQSSSLGVALDDAHSSVERTRQNSPTKATSSAPSKATLARSELTSIRVARAATIRGQNVTMEAIHEASKLIQLNTTFEKTAERRQQMALQKTISAQRRSDELQRRRANARLEALDRHYASQLRHAQPTEAAEIQRSLKQIRAATPQPSNSADRPRWMNGVDRPRTSTSVTNPNTSVTSVSDVSKKSAPRSQYQTARAYGREEKPPKAPAQPVKQEQSTLPPLSTNTSAKSRSSLMKSRPTPAFPVEQQLHDQMLTLATVVDDFAVSSRRLMPTTRTPMNASFRKAGRLHETAQADAAYRDSLFRVDLIELSPRSRIARWNMEVSDLLSEGDLTAATKVHATVKHEIAILEKGFSKGASKPSLENSNDRYAVLNLKCSYEANNATFARNEGRIADALRHLQRKMETEEAMWTIAATATDLTSAPRRRPLCTDAGASFESLLSASALLTTLGEPLAALQYARAASRIVSASAVRFEGELRTAAESSFWADESIVNELKNDTERLAKAAALALHNTAMAQLSCAASIRKGERAASPATFRACIDVATMVVGAHVPFTERLRQSASHFALAGPMNDDDDGDNEDWSAIDPNQSA